MSERKILIIGGSGFVGTRLIDILGEENCTNIDRKQSFNHDAITGLYDIREMNFSSEIDPSTGTVVLLAAEHRDDVNPVSLYFDVNVEGTRNVLRAMDSGGIKRIIFTSSVAVYGLNKDNPDEEHEPDPFNDYGISKLKAEKLLTEWYSESPADRLVVIIRPTVIFGENNRGNVFNLLRQVASGSFIMAGKGNNRKSMAYVGNVAAFIKYCMEKYKTGLLIFNYADKPDYTMNELIAEAGKKFNKKLSSWRLPFWLAYCAGLFFDMISKVTGRKFSISSIRVKKFCATTQFDTSKAYNSGFRPEFTLSEALDRTIQYEFFEGSSHETF
ncbi:MAG: NAD-dependent epimerase/dehydratase family protein [Bacteroidales bacterium]|jgi:nucleoside-diphosphate-sugar epimerase|nr:NAD-dependent epimerase/dehydratase family protein [Bacteroidales bacterium]